MHTVGVVCLRFSTRLEMTPLLHQWLALSHLVCISEVYVIYLFTFTDYNCQHLQIIW